MKKECKCNFCKSGLPVSHPVGIIRKQPNPMEEFDREVDYELTNSLSPITFGKLQQFINDNYISKEEEDEIYKNGWDNACKAIKGFIDDKLT